MKSYGYNLFDSNDPFYHDVCTLYTTEYVTDIIIEDRRKDYYQSNSNIILCQKDCEFVIYEKINSKSKCNCKIQIEEVQADITKIKIDKEFLKNIFLDTIKNSNFRVLLCYKEAFNIKTLLQNYGRIIMTLILVIFWILMILYFVKEKKKIKENLYTIMQNKLKYININPVNSHKIKIKKIIKRKKKLSAKSIGLNDLKLHSNKNINDTTKNYSNKNNNINIFDNNKTKNEVNIPKIKNMNNINFPNDSDIDTSERKKNNDNNSNNKKNGPPKKINQRNKVVNDNTNSKNSLLFSHNNLNNRYSESLRMNLYALKYKENNINNQNNNDDIKPKIVSDKINSINKDNNTNILKEEAIYTNMNDEELNSLEYEKALIYDKRTYFHYYWSLLKTKHLILFTFLITNDYNLLTLKTSLFLLAFSLYFTINGFFFSDDSIHKVYVDRGIYDFLYQIPKIFFSSVVSAIISVILKKLSLSEKNILELKKEKDLDKCNEKSKDIEKCLIIKFIIFFILSNILLLFFWYFISCFCGVYINTQIIFIKNIFSSFALSMIYPLGLNLIPGFFRLPAIKDNNKDQKCLYKISGYIAMI